MNYKNPNTNMPVLSVLFIWVAATAFWWAFAFLNLPTPTPAWLDRARDVCFGQTVTGLPEFRGWMTLIGPPLFLISSFVISYYDQLKQALTNFIHSKFGLIFTAIIGIAVFVEIILISQIIIERWPTPVTATIEESNPLPDAYPQTQIQPTEFNLVDQDNQPFSNKKFLNKKTILTFAFANCDTICPIVVKKSLNALEGRDKDKFQVVIITLDPWRDRPSRLTAALKMWAAPENAYFLSGETDAVLKTLKNYNIPYERNLKTGFVTHPPLVYILNEKGYITYTFNNPSTLWIKEALDKI